MLKRISLLVTSRSNMNYRVIISPNASRNSNAAVEYYKGNVSKKVALDFLADFQNTYKH
jgi:hypothetical protein